MLNIPAERKISMLKYILNNFQEAALQISYSEFVKGNKDESHENAIRASALGDILKLLKSDEELQKTFIMAQGIAETMGDTMNLMTRIINDIKESLETEETEDV